MITTDFTIVIKIISLMLMEIILLLRVKYLKNTVISISKAPENNLTRTKILLNCAHTVSRKESVQ